MTRLAQEKNYTAASVNIPYLFAVNSVFTVTIGNLLVLTSMYHTKNLI